MLSTYRDMLMAQFDARCRRNPKYSRRAFARDLGLSPSQLSEVLHGDRGLSPGKAATIVQRLQLPQDDSEIFCDMVESEHARDGARRAMAQSRLASRMARRSFHDMTLDSFVLIAEWYHLAILELLKVKGFRSETSWIARTLGVGGEAIEGAIRRLTRLGLVHSDAGRLHTPAEKEKTSTPDDVPSQAVRSFHAQILQKALAAIKTQPVDEREFGTLLLAIKKERLPEAKRLMREFQCRFSELMQDAGERDEVYALSTQFFRLSSVESTESP